MFIKTVHSWEKILIANDILQVNHTITYSENNFQELLTSFLSAGMQFSRESQVKQFWERAYWKGISTGKWANRGLGEEGHILELCESAHLRVSSEGSKKEASRRNKMEKKANIWSEANIQYL